MTRGRGGFSRLHTQGTSGPISFDLYYRERPKDRPITCEIQIDQDARGRARVTYERLRQRRRGQRHGRPFTFLWLTDGAGIAWEGEQDAGIDEEPDDFRDYLESLVWEESKDREWVELTDQNHLGIATLGALKQHPRIAAFRRFIEGWHLSYFSPDAARSLSLAGPQKHLNVHGDNLGNVVQFVERDYPDRFRTVLARIADKIPGIDKIDTERTSDGRLLLRFNDRGFSDPHTFRVWRSRSLEAGGMASGRQGEGSMGRAHSPARGRGAQRVAEFSVLLQTGSRATPVMVRQRCRCS